MPLNPKVLKNFHKLIFPIIDELDDETKRNVAVVFIGFGSEFYGYDDLISCDHDFLLLPSIIVNTLVSPKIYFNLIKKYEKAVWKFYQDNNFLVEEKSGVYYVNDFLKKIIGTSEVTNIDLLDVIEQHQLFTLTHGFVLYDEGKFFNKILDTIKSTYFIHLKKKKLASCLFLMHQSGIYNYERLLLRNEILASNLAIFEFINAFIQFIYFFNDEFVPFYKWQIRGMEKFKNNIRYQELINDLMNNFDKGTSIKKTIELVKNELLTAFLINNNCSLLDCAYQLHEQSRDFKKHILE